MDFAASFGRERSVSNQAECKRLALTDAPQPCGFSTTIDLPFGSVSAPVEWIHQLGPFLVVADARIDDRRALHERLGEGIDRSASAPSLIAKAWAKWGEDAVDRLIGDFAFFVIQREHGTVHLVRDFMSRRPLHFRMAAGRLSVTSRPSRLADRSRAVDVETVARHLALFPQSGRETFFRGVERVEPGTIVHWRDGRLDVRRFWQAPRPTRRIGRSEAIETASALLAKAATDRLSTDLSGGALQLSGGMDSSMVAVAVGRAGIEARAMIAMAAPGADPPPQGYVPEDGTAALATAALYPSLHAQRCVTTPRPWQAIAEEWNSAADQPLRNYENIDWIGATVRAAADGGATTLLTGDFGNDSLSHDGTAIFAEDLGRGRWRSFVHNGRALRQLSAARWRGIAAYALGPYAPAPVWRELNHLPRPIQAVANAGMFRRDHPLVARLVARAAADRHDLSMRPPASAWAIRSRMVDWVDTGLLTAALRGKFGVTLTDPTADRRVVEFTLSLPAEHWFVDGRQRALARAMLDGRVPDAVVNPVGRGLQGCDWRQSAELSLPWLREEVERLHATELGEALDLPRMVHMLKHWPTEGWSSNAQLETHRYTLMRAISMGHFARIRDGAAAP